MALFGRNNTASKNSTIHNIRALQSVLGAVVPILIGQDRLPGSLIWYGDFQVHDQKTKTGGKGLGSKSTTTHDYTAATVELLCHGPVSYIASVWDSKGMLSAASANETFTVPTGGGAYNVANASGFASDAGVGFQQAYSTTVTDYGSPSAVSLSGTYILPMVLVSGPPATGQYSVSPTGQYIFSSSDAGKVISVNYVFNLQYLSKAEVYTIPSSLKITVEEANNFNRNVSVLAYPTGVPIVGATNDSYGVYTLPGWSVGQNIQITYYYQDPNYNTLPTTNLNLTLFTGAVGQAPWGYLASKHPGQSLGYSSYCYVGCPEVDLGSGASLPNYNYEVVSIYGFGAGITDVHPVTAIYQLLTNAVWGADFPTTACDNWAFGNGSAWNFWAANSFFISTVLTSQKSCAEWIQSWCEAGQVAPFFSEGLLKLVPYGDTSAAGNGRIFQPNTSPIVDLTDADFIAADGEEPVQFTRMDPLDIYNVVRVEYMPRNNSYNTDIIQEDDQAHIAEHGRRVEAPKSYDFIKTLPAAQFAANMRLRRLVNINLKCQFRISAKRYPYLEPMDLVTLTSPSLGLNKYPVRIHQTINSPNGELSIVAGEFPWGTATATLYPKQWPPSGYVPTAGQADPGNTSAIIFEAPNRLALHKGNVLYLIVSGSQEDWGGCEIWVSVDGGTTYFQQSSSALSATVGVLQNSMGTIPVGLTNSSGANGGLAVFIDIPNTGTFGLTQPWYLLAGWAIAGSASAPTGLTGGNAYSSSTVNGSIDIPSPVTHLASTPTTIVTGWCLSKVATINNDIVVTVNGVNLGFAQYYIQRVDVASAYPSAPGSANGFGFQFTLTTTGYTPGTVNTLTVGFIDALGNYGHVDTTFYVSTLAVAQVAVTIDGQGMGNAIYGKPRPDVAIIYPGQGNAPNLGWTFALYTQAYSLDTNHTVVVTATDTRGHSASATSHFYIPSANYASIVLDRESMSVPNTGDPGSNLAVVVSANTAEIISYSAPSLLGAGTYSLVGIQRAQMGSSQSAHTVGDDVAFLEPSTPTYQYDPWYVGKTIYFKFLSFNTLHNRKQTLDQVAAIGFTIDARNSGAVALETGIFQTGFGSVAPQFSTALSYVSGPDSITWSWIVPIYRTDIQQTVNTLTGSQSCAGLASAITYDFYPYCDDKVPGGSFQMVQTAGVGSAPTWAHIGDNLAWDQEQWRADHTALSKGPVLASTTIAGGGTGGGSGGGSGTPGGGSSGGSGGGAGTTVISGQLLNISETLFGLSSATYNFSWVTLNSGSDNIVVYGTSALFFHNGGGPVQIGSGPNGTSSINGPVVPDMTLYLVDTTTGNTLDTQHA